MATKVDFVKPKRRKILKIFGATILVLGLVLGAAFLGGAFEANVKIQMNEKVKQNVVEYTTDTIEKTKETADAVLTKLQKKIADAAKEKDTNE